MRRPSGMRNTNRMTFDALGFVTDQFNRVGIVANGGVLGNGQWFLATVMYGGNTGTVVAAILENSQPFQQGFSVCVVGKKWCC